MPQSRWHAYRCSSTAATTTRGQRGCRSGLMQTPGRLRSRHLTITERGGDRMKSSSSAIVSG